MINDDFVRSPFGEGVDWRLNACVGKNGGPYNYYDYAQGYFEAGNAVAEKVILEGRGMDVAIYPILYLYRHALELSLKHFTRIKTGKPVKTHGLDALWKEGKEIIANLLLAEEEKYFLMLESAVTNFNQIDPIAEVARYPETSTGKKHITLNEMSIINIQPIYEQLTEVAKTIQFLNYLQAIKDKEE